ncbi:MAG: CPBP family intramembrane metalloprotease [Ruminococcus sp.]|nr:CPBP family intramembrane metalloprotease [Ruminococcus sp.]
MNEELYRAEIYSLSREIQRLNRQIDEGIKKNAPDKLNPFENPTDYPDFSGDYSDIMPEINAPDCIVPLDPAPMEKHRLKRFYSVGGWCVLAQFVLSNILMYVLMVVIRMIIQSESNGVNVNTIYYYMESTSVFAGLNMLIYMFANIGFGFLGLKMAHIPKKLLVRTRNFDFIKAIAYCMIAVFIWTVSVFASAGINDIFVRYGYTTDVMGMDNIAQSGIGFAVMMIYQCVVAPITEEIFFRGMLLRVFSRANQRFAVFASAFFFGIGHHNLPQFVLAFLIGIFLAHITLKHNSIIPAVIVHIFINSMSNAISLADMNLGAGAIVYVESAVFAVAVGGIPLLLKFRETNKLPSTTPPQSRRGIAVAKKSVIFVISVVVQVLYTVYLIYSM